ncbi:glycosyltransferase [Aquincola sp. J276]|uniref:glycosyltransferase n=1 Tax=Aquincola sp. J276 TaxID=2898432 RepID=UPI0021517D1F|nr:glycosyltransferase [Aquincola sp. J276]MCR5866949.1 glycosyltransferase [Aquincola sp. J276]
MSALRIVLLGDGDSPHLLKWARALAAEGVDLWAASSRGFLPGFDAVLPPGHRLAMHTRPRFGGGNLQVLRTLPRLARWLREVRPDWLHAHYLTSHGTLGWLAQAGLGVPGRLVGSAWGSDILVTPDRHPALRWLTSRVLRACSLTTSDSLHMAARMQALGAAEVMTFPFGLDALPAPSEAKDDRLFFANRGLEPIYQPQRVVEAFAAIAAHWPDARLVVANDGSLRHALERQVQNAGLADQVRFTGRLDADEQARLYGQARWYLSLPASDSVSVSVLEAMAHGCIPLLSDLPANHELVRSGSNGLVLADGALPAAQTLQPLLARGGAIASDNRAWVAEHALFAPCVRRFLARLQALDDAAAARAAR